MKKHNAFDRARWTIQTGAGDPIQIETSNGTTWALRALMAAGDGGLHPIDTGGGRWANLVAGLRDLGLPVDDLPEDDNGRRGYRLCATVRRAR